MEWIYRVFIVMAMFTLMVQAHAVFKELQQIRQHIETIKGDIPMSTLGN